jgi:MSHA biogenesis protein MshG
MRTYRYKGRNRRGELLEGTIESPSAQAVARWMLDTRIFPVTIDLEKPPPESPLWLARLIGENKVTLLEVEYFTRQMGTLSRSGLSMLQAIQSLQRANTGKGMGKILRALVADLDKGASLSRALARHPTVFDAYYLSMVRVGEDSGRLSEIWLALLRQLSFDREMRQRLSAVVRYPIFVLGALLVATLILLIFVIPVFSNVYQSMRVDLPLITQSLITASDFVIRYWWGILGALALGGLGASQWVRTREGRYAWDKIQLRLPIFGPILRKVAIGRFCESFATAHRSGVPLVDAFDLVSRIVDNAFLEERILQMRQGLERGESFSRVARGASIFNQTELQMIIVGEESGDIEKMVSQIAGMHQEEVAYDVTRLSKSMEPVLLGFMGVLVGLLLLGIFTPLWDLGQLNRRPA